MMLLLVVLAATATVAAAAEVTNSAVPAVLVFENLRYQRQLAASVTTGTLDIVDCSDIHRCNPPPADVANRAIAVVSALPRNTSLFPTLPRLQLFHSSFYVALDLYALTMLQLLLLLRSCAAHVDAFWCRV